MGARETKALCKAQRGLILHFPKNKYHLLHGLASIRYGDGLTVVSVSLLIWAPQKLKLLQKKSHPDGHLPANSMKPLKTTWFSPYTQKNNMGNLVPGKGIRKKFNNKSGVYLIKSVSSGQVVYVGVSTTNLYRTAYRHFQTWNDAQQQRKVFNPADFLIRFIFCPPSRAIRLEQYLIDVFKPEFNETLYQVTQKEVFENSQYVDSIDWIGAKEIEFSI